MLKHHGKVIVFAQHSISIFIFFLVLSFANQVEGSRPHTDKLSTTSIDRFKLFKAYSGPSKRGIGHAIMHYHFATPIKRLKITRAYNSGPSKRAIGHMAHTLMHLMQNRSPTPINRFKMAKTYSSRHGDNAIGH